MFFFCFFHRQQKTQQKSKVSIEKTSYETLTNEQIILSYEKIKLLKSLPWLGSEPGIF
jgi:hypothetical protein